MSEEPVLLDRVLQSSRRYNTESDTWENIWGSQILCYHGARLAYEDLADRLCSGTLGFAVVARGYKADEVEKYTQHLNTACQGIRSADDALDDPLPAVAIENVEDSGVGIPLLRHAQTPDDTIQMRSWAFSWGGWPPIDSSHVNRLFTHETNAQFVARQKSLREAVANARRRKATKWWSMKFSHEALRAVYLSNPGLVRSWVKAALDDTAPSRALLHWCEGFYQALCTMLVSEEPGLGFRLWYRMRDRGITVQFIDHPCGIDLFSALPFSARESNEAEQERSKMLERCSSDLLLLNLATMAGAYGQSAWMIEQSRQLLAMTPLWRRAKGIALICLSDVDASLVDQLISTANVDGSWVADLFSALHAYHHRNQWAKHWYKRFLTVSDRDESWAAFHLFLRCVDRRCGLWIDRIEQELASSTTFDQARMKFRRTHNQQIKNAIDSNEKDLKACFLTLKFQDRELFPFIGDAF